ALRDAIVAANHLVPALRQATLDAIVKAGAQIQQDREPEVVAIQRLQLAAMSLPPLMRSPALRRTILPVLRRAGIIKKMMLRSELLFRHGTTDVQVIESVTCAGPRMAHGAKIMGECAITSPRR
ncbi:MAG: hypothetical protein ABMA15_29705, partial [Vicinamibacterales bacterium]